MRQKLTILTCLTILMPILALGQINSIGISQESIENDDCIAITDTLTSLKVFSIVDRMPEPTEGLQSLYEKIAEIQIKPTVREPRTGTIIVAFIVTVNADLTGMRIVGNIKGLIMQSKYLE